MPAAGDSKVLCLLKCPCERVDASIRVTVFLPRFARRQATATGHPALRRGETRCPGPIVVFQFSADVFRACP